MAVVTLVKAPGQAGSMFILGHGDMVFSFFSTVSYHLEGPGNWGKIFPRLLLDLCDHGLVENKYLDELSKELVIVSQGLKKFPISSAV